jgi:hypothetical protein
MVHNARHLEDLDSFAISHLDVDIYYTLHAFTLLAARHPP